MKVRDLSLSEQMFDFSGLLRFLSKDTFNTNTLVQFFPVYSLACIGFSGKLYPFFHGKSYSPRIQNLETPSLFWKKFTL